MKELTPYQKAALNYEKHISLTANAGSGKTFVFTKRFLETLISLDIGLENIIAITFTDKAASELYSRISNEIEERLKTEKDKSKRIKLEMLRRGLVSANISTIHSFCIDILRENAPSAGLDANFITIDNSVTNELIDLSIEELFRNFYNKKELEDEIKYLLRYFISKNMLIKELRSAINKRRDTLNLYNKIYSKEIKFIANFFKENFKKQFLKIVKPEIDKNLIKIENINNYVLSISPNNEFALEASKTLAEINVKKTVNRLILQLKRLSEILLTKSGSIKKQGYLTSKDRNDRLNVLIQDVELMFKSLSGLFAISKPELVETELAKFGKNFATVSARLIEIYQNKKTEKAYLDFEDILIHTEKLIANKDIRKQLSQKFRYVMIDEYQDTNEIQYNIFMPILNYLKSGNLFIVGDEKQSIYMFRNAELEIFNKTKDELKENKNESEILILPHSFRLAPNIAAFTNELFKLLMSNPVKEFNEVEYSELICARPEKPEGKIEFIISGEDSPEESELVAKKILELRRQNLDFGKIAVLCRKRSAFAELEKSFVKFKIPYAIIGGKGFFQQQIILDLNNYLSFLINPNNDNALVGLLRSPFYSLSDEEILEISLCDGNSFFEKLRNYSKGKNSFSKIVTEFDRNIDISQKISLTKLVRKLFRETGYWSVLASKINSDQELANLNKLISVANKFSQQSFTSLYDFVNFLTTSIESAEDEGQALLAGDQNAVNIMTLHKAKGLEYKAVFLFKSHEIVQDNSAKSKSVFINKHFGIMTKVPVNGNYFEPYSPAPITWLSDYIEKRKNLAEFKRLLYVGITRAEDYLFITATKRKQKFPDSTFIGIIFKALERFWDENSFKLNSVLKFMKQADEEYKVYEKEIKLEIPVLHSVDSTFHLDSGEEKLYDVKEIKAAEIPDREKNEIISATKITVYSQCPLKYKLTYELGYSKLFKMQKEFKNLYEFNIKEDDELKILSDVRGRIIHEVLQRQVELDYLENEVESLIDSELKLKSIAYSEMELLRENILSDLKKFYSSGIYTRLKKHDKFYNEFEVYAKEKDFFLYGIIDKLIIDKDKIIIADYKSDIISVDRIKHKAKEYFTQLKFYAYVLSKLYQNVNLFELRLIFIKHPGIDVAAALSKEEVFSFGKIVSDFVSKIRAKEFAPDLSHCKNCHFSPDRKNCVVKFKPG